MADSVLTPIHDKSLSSQAVYQAIGSTISAEENLGELAQFRSEYSADAAQLLDGGRQNGTAAWFEYQYSLTGFEMGVHDAPELVFHVHGVCATYYGTIAFFPSPANVRNRGFILIFRRY